MRACACVRDHLSEVTHVHLKSIKLCSLHGVSTFRKSADRGDHVFDNGSAHLKLISLVSSYFSLASLQKWMCCYLCVAHCERQEWNMTMIWPALVVRRTTHVDRTLYIPIPFVHCNNIVSCLLSRAVDAKRRWVASSDSPAQTSKRKLIRVKVVSYAFYINARGERER